MKVVFWVIVALLLSIAVTGQDLVVMPEGDSLNCAITKIKNQNIYFIFKYKGETRNTLIPLSEVRAYQYGFYRTHEVEVEENRFSGDYSKFRLSLGGGLSYRIASLPDGVSSAERNYLRELKSGFGFAAEASYFVSESFGIGVWYASHMSKFSQSSITLSLPNGMTYSGPISDDISIRFIGPSLTTQLWQGNKKGVGMIDFSAGYLSYRDISTLGSSFLRIEGATFGFATGIGYDILLSKHVGFGLNVSLIAGTLTKINMISSGSSTTITLDEESYESLARVDITAGLRLFR